jgi:hypothetical protein
VLLLDDLDEQVARARREGGAGEEERREGQADGGPAEAGALPRLSYDVRPRARAPARSQHRQEDGGQRQQDEAGDQAWKAMSP